MRPHTRRAAMWLIVVSGGVVLLIVAALLALPEVVRHLAVRQLADTTAEPVSIANVDFNAFTGSFHADGVRVGEPGPAPVLAIPAVDGRLRLWPLLSGRVRLDEATFTRPVLRIARVSPLELNVSAAVERWRQQPPRRKPLDASIDRLTVVDGTLIFEDRVLEPVRRWSAEHLSVELLDIATAPSADPGSGLLTFSVGEGRVSVAARTLDVAPFMVETILRVDGVALTPFLSYLPPNREVVPTRARLDGVVTATYDARDGLDGNGWMRLRDVVLERVGHAQPFVTVPELLVSATELTVRGAEIAAGQVSVTAAPTIVDAQASPPARFEFTSTSFAMKDLRWPGGPPSPVEIAGTLADGATLTGRGTLDLDTLSSDLRLVLSGVRLAQFSGYLPPGAPIAVRDGVLGARLHARHRGAGEVQASGTGTVSGFALTRRGAPGDMVAAPALAFSVVDLALNDGIVTARRMEMAGDPVVTDTSVSPPRRFRFPDSRIVAEAMSWPTGPPGRVEATSRVASGGSIAVRGTVAPSPVSADLVVAARDLDLRPLSAYVPRPSPVGLGTGILTTRASVRYSGGAVRVDGEATVRELTALRRDRGEPFLSAPAVEIDVKDLAFGGGRFGARRVAVSAAPTVTDALASPPQRFAFETVRLTITDAARPSARPAAVEFLARASRGGTVQGAGTVNLGSFETTLSASIAGVPVTRAQPYLPAGAPVALASGTGSGQVTFQYSPSAAPRVSAELTVRDFALDREGQRETFVSVPVLTASVDDLAMGPGRTRADRLSLRGDVRVVEGWSRPARHFEVRDAEIVLTDAAWPSAKPATLRISGELGAGRLEVNGSVEAPPVRAALNALATDVDASLLAGYIPGVAVEGGTMSAKAQIRHEADATTIDGQVTGAGLGVSREGSAFAAAIPSLTVAVENSRFGDGRVTAARVTFDGEASVVDRTAEGARPVVVESVHVVAERLAWPEARAMPIAVDAAFAGGGSLSASGIVRLGTDASALQIEARAVPATVFGPFLPIEAPVRGKIDADLALGIALRPALRITATGTARANELALGPRRRPPLAVQRASVTGLDVDWPRRVAIGALVLGEPSVLVERTEKGDFPLRDMLLGPRPAPEAPAPGPTRIALSGPVVSTPRPDRPPRRPVVEIDRFVVEDGDIRFVDRSTSPFYSEELSELAITVEDFSTEPDERAALTVHGVLGVHSAIDLRGDVAPFGDPFFLDVEGEIRDFPVARVNPYAQKLLDWIARTGQVTTRVHYRVVGDRLEATNEIVVERLSVARAGREREVQERLGVPLGLAVALLKDARGDIRLTVPVTGRLGAPEFSFRDAMGTALRNIVAKAITAPFRLFGKLFQRDGETAAPEIAPIEFTPGRAIVTPALERELQRVADFLRASPHVALELQPVVSQTDLRELATRQVTARVQDRQRARGLPSFDAAAAEEFRQRFPARAVPETTEAIVEALREAEPMPEAAGWRLAERRLASTRRMLTERAGIAPARLRESDRRIPLGDSGDGRVEFTLVPAG